MDFAEWFKTLKKAPWDEAPKAWKEFWAVRTQAAVIEMDVEKETVDAKEVEGIGLNPPKDKARRSSGSRPTRCTTGKTISSPRGRTRSSTA